jgi:histidinol-phosphate phosphatase family protein
VRFVGIDLAWSPRNRSGGAILSQDGQLIDAIGTLGDDEQILAYAQDAFPDQMPGIVAVDAPLAVPNESGGRPCDRQVASAFGPFQAGPYPANRKNLARYGGLRAEAIRHRLTALGFRHDPDFARQERTRRVVEVFPHPATVSLFDLDRTLKYKVRQGRDLAFRRTELARLRDLLIELSAAEPPLRLPNSIACLPIEELRGKAFKEAEDLLDAIVCAYSVLYAWHYGPRGFAIYGPENPGQSTEEGHILVPMKASMWQRLKRPRLLMLDRDGTLNASLGSRPPNRPDEVELLPNVGAKLRWYAAQGWRLVVITNQGGVAYGYRTETQVHRIHRAVMDALPVGFDASYLCPHHPNGSVPRYAVSCPNRKPAPGAILDAMDRFQVKAVDSLFVGDRDSDRLAAVAAGVPFRWAEDFFNWRTISERRCQKSNSLH